MIKLKDILNEGSNNPANIKAYYEALCKSEKVTPLPVKFNNIGKGGAALTYNPKTMKALYISFNVNRMQDPEYAVIHELTHQIKLENKLVEKYMYSKFSNILWKESLDEKLSITGGAAREILSTILPKTVFAKGDIESQKNQKKMVDDLVKTLNNFYEKYNIDKKIIL